jgi:hypothetical protein
MLRQEAKLMPGLFHLMKDNIKLDIEGLKYEHIEGLNNSG